MTDRATALAPCGRARQRERRSSPARSALDSPPVRLALPGARVRCTGSRPIGTGAERLGTGLDLPLRRLPNLSPASPATVGRMFRALVKVKMSTPGACSPAMPRMPAEETPPPSPDTALRSLEDLDRAGQGAAGTGQARNSIARSRDPKARARCDPRAESLAGSLAGPMTRSSFGGSSPVVRPAHGPRGVAG